MIIIIIVIIKIAMLNVVICSSKYIENEEKSHGHFLVFIC